MKKKASITVESTIICPIFIFAIVVLISILNWFVTAEKAQQALSFAVRNRAVAGDILSEKEYISLYKFYSMNCKMPIYAFYSPKILQRANERAFIGSDTFVQDEDDPIVYMTPSGSVAHIDKTCTYLKVILKKYRVSQLSYLRNHGGAKYYPCSRCAMDVTGNDVVYVSVYGTRYHVDANCTAINRNIIALRYSQSNGTRLCSKCSGEN